MVKHTQTIRQQFADKLFVFDNFVGLALKGLKLQSHLEETVYFWADKLVKTCYKKN